MCTKCYYYTNYNKKNLRYDAHDDGRRNVMSLKAKMMLSLLDQKYKCCKSLKSTHKTNCTDVQNINVSHNYKVVNR